MIILFSLQKATDASTDLIELDSSLSFEVDDFDPLNQNARQIPPVPKRLSVVLPLMSSSLPSSTVESVTNPNYPYHQSRAQAFSNPVYPYHQPLGQPMNFIGQSSNSSPVPSNYKEDENELLRKYGLDRLNLVDAKKLNRTTINDNAPNPFALSINNRNSIRTIDPFLDNKSFNGLKTNGDIQTKTNNNWTTFD